MIRFKNLVLLIFLLNTFFLNGAVNFKRIDQWKHDEICTSAYSTFIDKDGRLIGHFQKGVGVFVISKDKIQKFGYTGEAPNDLMMLMAGFPMNNDLAFVEMPQRMKVFGNTNGNYTWKKNIWLDRGKLTHVIRAGLFFDNKFFLAGMETVDYNSAKRISNLALLRVLDDKGKLLKLLLNKKDETEDNSNALKYLQMESYLAGYKTDLVYYMMENALKVSVISSKTLKEIKEVNLEVPSFYKKMPSDFYTYKKGNKANNPYKDLEKWSVGYSRIIRCLVEGNSLVVQIRTCNEKMKNFAVLFYNADTFKLENIVFTDDYLMAARNGKYYCFANGEPGQEETAEELTVNIYTLESKK